MIITGFQKTTLLDYPGHVAATVFTKGCNLRCPFCHNGSLVLNGWDTPVIPEEEVLSILRKRSRVLEGVCVSGGEPTLQSDLSLFLEKVKELGLKIKLDTNGTNPAILKELISDGLVDYVAMDIKAGRGNYYRACGVMGSGTDGFGSDFAGYDGTADKGALLCNIEESVKYLISGTVDYEFRTTAVKGIHGPEDFQDIRELLYGAKRYYLQSYAESDGVIDKSCGAFSKDELDSFLEIVKATIPEAKLRGIE